MDALKLLIVEDDPAVCQMYREYVEAFDDIEIVSISHTAADAIESVRRLRPHAVLLSLELQGDRQMPVEVLQGLAAEKLTGKAFVIAVSDMYESENKEYYRAIRENGVDYALCKRQIDYTDQTPIDFLRMMNENGRLISWYRMH